MDTSTQALCDFLLARTAEGGPHAETHQRVVEMAQAEHEEPMGFHATPAFLAAARGRAALADDMLRVLAAAYSDHPDYDASWRTLRGLESAPG